MGIAVARSTALVFPPLWDTLGAPPLGPAVLAGALRGAALPRVFHDLNLDFFSWLFADETLAELLSAARVAEATEELAELERLLGTQGRRRAVGPGRAAAVFVLATSLGMQSRPLLGPSRYLAGIHSSRVRLAELVSATPEGSVAAFWQRWMDARVASVAEGRPHLVAITVSHVGQLLPAASLAHRLRRLLPEVPILAGGPYCTTMATTDVDLTPLFAAFDGIGVGPGEEVIVRAAQSAPILPGDAPGLWIAGGSRPPLGKPAPASPDYAALPLDRYGEGEHAPWILLETSRGCWARCRYCNYRALNRGYRVKPVEQVAAEVADVQQRLPGASVSFVDDTIAPRRALAVARAVARVSMAIGRTIEWEGCLRPDAGLGIDACRALRAGGMHRVFIGFDAATEAMLQEIDKRATLDQIRALVRNLRMAGIVVSGNFIVGLPGETEVDQLAILDLIEDLELDPSQVTTSLFGLVRGSWYYAHLDEMGWPAEWVARVKANDALTDFLPTPRVDPEARRAHTGERKPGASPPSLPVKPRRKAAALRLR
ncbi:MAG: B12-binding domain-containing radical SAM protein [Polyangiaceae bacterium]|nr:B12-binding domain-containing radical SAM protein [Polyangiaceae bacterium]